MAHESNESRAKYDELTGKLGEEFKLPNISSPWLTQVFELRNDVLDWSEVAMADFDMIQALDFPPLKPVNFDLGVEKEVPVTFAPDICYVRPHLDNSVERLNYLENRRTIAGGSPSPADRSLLDQPRAEPDEEIWCDVPITYPSHLLENVNREGFGENEIEE